ncbi:MAG: hypothetical protein NTW79_04020 [Candidatus Berkelbacteria bacterium]|nr:hypothetical protein [Candidatus Berkelbacteria bacterium]
MDMMDVIAAQDCEFDPEDDVIRMNNDPSTPLILIGPFVGYTKEIVVKVAFTDCPKCVCDDSEDDEDDPLLFTAYIGLHPIFDLCYSGEEDSVEERDRVLREITKQSILYAEFVMNIPDNQLSVVTARHRKHIEEVGGLDTWRDRLVGEVRRRIPDFSPQ